MAWASVFIAYDDDDDDDDQKSLDILGWWKNFNKFFTQTLFLRLEVFKHNFLLHAHRVKQFTGDLYNHKTSEERTILGNERQHTINEQKCDRWNTGYTWRGNSSKGPKCLFLSNQFLSDWHIIILGVLTPILIVSSLSWLNINTKTKPGWWHFCHGFLVLPQGMWLKI